MLHPPICNYRENVQIKFLQERMLDKTFLIFLFDLLANSFDLVNLLLRPGSKLGSTPANHITKYSQGEVEYRKF